MRLSTIKLIEALLEQEEAKATWEYREIDGKIYRQKDQMERDGASYQEISDALADDLAEARKRDARRKAAQQALADFRSTDWRC